MGKLKKNDLEFLKNLCDEIPGLAKSIRVLELLGHSTVSLWLWLQHASNLILCLF